MAHRTHMEELVAGMELPIRMAELAVDMEAPRNMAAR
jgi:hypothetical protein